MTQKPPTITIKNNHKQKPSYSIKNKSSSGVSSISKNAAGSRALHIIFLESEISLFTPLFRPAVSHQPVVLIEFVIVAIADHQHGVVNPLGTLRIHNTPRVELELLRGINSHRHGLLIHRSHHLFGRILGHVHVTCVLVRGVELPTGAIAALVGVILR